MENTKFTFDNQDSQSGLKRTKKVYSNLQSFGNFAQNMEKHYQSNKLDRKNSQNGLWMSPLHSENRKRS